MRTGLRFRCILKEDMIPVISAYFDLNGNQKEVSKRYSKYSFLNQQTIIPNCDEIPSCVPHLDDFPVQNEWDNNQNHLLIYTTREWRFQCVVEGSGMEYFVFLNVVCNNMVDEVKHIEIMNDSFEVSVYNFIDGILKPEEK